MTKTNTRRTLSNDRYFDLKSEKLVLEGYRHWNAGYETGSIRPWEACWNLYAVELGAIEGRRAIGELSNLVRTLRRCANCPLRYFPQRSRVICLEESLTMGLVAGKQHGDQDTVSLCLEVLACPFRDDAPELAAEQFADTLCDLGQVMRLIPQHVVQDVVDRSRDMPKTLN